MLIWNQSPCLGSGIHWLVQTIPCLGEPRVVGATKRGWNCKKEYRAVMKSRINEWGLTDRKHPGPPLAPHPESSCSQWAAPQVSIHPPCSTSMSLLMLFSLPLFFTFPFWIPLYPLTYYAPSWRGLATWPLKASSFEVPWSRFLLSLFGPYLRKDICLALWTVFKERDYVQVGLDVQNSHLSDIWNFWWIPIFCCV